MHAISFFLSEASPDAPVMLIKEGPILSYLLIYRLWKYLQLRMMVIAFTGHIQSPTIRIID